MHRKISAGGFIEILMLLAGFTGLTTIGIILTSPKTLTSQPQAVQTTIYPTSISQIPSATPTLEPDIVTTSETIGVRLTKDFQLQVIVDGSPVSYTLLGVNSQSSGSADCVPLDAFDEINNKLTGKTIYVVQYEDNISDINARYIYLSDGTMVNLLVIAEGQTKAEESNHPYYEDFLNAQLRAEENKRGIWSDECIKNPSPVQTPASTSTPAPTAIPTKKLYPTYTPTPSQKPKSEIKGEATQIIPTATPVIPATQKPEVIANSAPNSLSPDLILELINNHRKSKNLPAFEKDQALCSIAESRAPELYDEIFVNGNIHAGFFKRNIPFWITENMAGYGSESANVNWWLGSTIHRNAIEGDYKYSCGACAGGNCVQLFTSWLPK